MTLMYGELKLEEQVLLKEAWLIYQDTSNLLVDVVRHRVRDVRGELTLGEGVPLSMKGVRGALRQLVPRAPLTVLGQNILASNEDTLVFYRPPSPATLSFAGESTALRALSGEALPQPGLIFIVHAGSSSHAVTLFAHKGKKRPDADTPLFHAPYPNMFANHQVCWGSSLNPRSIEPQFAQEWEHAFLNSAFTHSQVRQHRFRGSSAEMWNAALAQGRFPPSALAPVQSRIREKEVTLGQWIQQLTNTSAH